MRRNISEFISLPPTDIPLLASKKGLPGFCGSLSYSKGYAKMKYPLLQFGGEREALRVEE